MEARLKALEDFVSTARERLARIEAKLDTFATKEDIHRAISDQTWKLITWVSGVAAGLVAAVFFIARNVH